MASKFLARRPYIILALLIVAIDRWTKWMIDTNLSLNQTVSVIDGFFNITYVQNTGVAFGILNSVSSPIKVIVLSLMTACAVAALVSYSLRSPVNNRILQTALSLILAGALGNLYDRVRFGHVIDFLEFYYHTYYWHVFNVADSAISAGVALLALELFRNDSPTSTPAKTPSRA